MTDILLEWHPIMVARIIKNAIGNRQQKEIAKILGITQQYVSLILDGVRPLSAEVAGKLHRIGVDGRYLYAMQERRRVEIQWRYDTGAIERPALVSREGGEKIKRAKPQNKSVYREAARKAAQTRKRLAAARAEAAQQQKDMEAA